MKKFAITAATATALTLTMATAHCPDHSGHTSTMTVVTGEVPKPKKSLPIPGSRPKSKPDLVPRKASRH